MRRMLFSFFLFFFSSYYAGFSPDTIVLRPQGFMPLGQLQKSSSVASYNLTANAITQGTVSSYNTQLSSHACRVICDNGISFVASPDQIVMANSQWRVVKDLKKGDRLKCCDVSRRSGSTETGSSYVIVLSVEAWNDEQLLCEITVEPYHTFCVTPRGIIAHNHPIAIFGVAPPVISALSKVAIGGVISGTLWSLFGKNKNRYKNHFIQESSPSGCSSPPPSKKPNDEDEFRKKHPHGRYEDVGYHKNHQSGRKSPRPINGQGALDNSVELNAVSKSRIGVSSKQIVMLKKTAEGLYHGYVVEWSGLERWICKLLSKANLVDKLGKILR